MTAEDDGDEDNECGDDEDDGDDDAGGIMADGRPT